MKTQISRNSLQPGKRYSGVYQQQGRMITDADWNELTDLDKHRLWNALRDAIGSGAPTAGGLAVNPDKTLQPGVLYAEGVPAKLEGGSPVAFTAQPDFPGAPALPANTFTLYADVWDRAVTSLEDLVLVDPGLHGADTCSRTQTMLQVKWCPNAGDPADLNKNPPKGNGRLALQLRTTFSGGDPCDPCAAQVNVDNKVGNYLFRVEVHDRYQQGGHDFLVLKWSRDNGSEQYPVASAPPDFKQGDWIYEFFNDVTEKNLGVHLAAGFTPLRGKLVDGYTVPTAPADPKTYGRQWDGCCTIDLTAKTLAATATQPAKDRGVALSTTYGLGAQGLVTLGAALQINLDLLVFNLQLDGCNFVAGDYWLATVREATQSAGDFVLGTSLTSGVPPLGIHHHYVWLADIDGSGAVIAPTDAEKRQFHFPPLTNLQAYDVGFTNNCATLFTGAQNVQQALDALCLIAADDIAYTVPGCPAPSVAALMAASVAGWPDFDGDHKVTVKDMLDALLCKLSASYLPYNGAIQGPRWTAIKSEATPSTPPGTVQQALDDLVQYLDSKDIPHYMQNCPAGSEPTVRTALGLTGAQYPVSDILTALLCQKQAGGSSCCVCIGPGGDFQTLQNALDAFAANPAPWTDLILCLKPGTHVLLGNVEVTGKRSVKITGSGTSASIIQFQGATFHIQAQEIAFEDVAVVATQAGGQLILEAPSVSAEDSLFRRAGNNPTAPALIAVNAASNGGSVFFQNNTLQSTWQRVRPGINLGSYAPVSVVGAKTAAAFQNLFADETLSDPDKFNAALIDLSNQVAALPPSTRTAWVQAAPKALAAAPAKAKTKSGAKSSQHASTAKAKKAAPAPLKSDAKSASFAINVIGNITSFPVIRNNGVNIVASTQNFYTHLTQAKLNLPSVQSDLAGLVLGLIESGFCQALTLSSIQVGGSLAYNTVNGEVVVLNNGAAGADIGKNGVLQQVGSLVVASVSPISANGAKLDLVHNSIARFSQQVPAAAISSGRLVAALPAYSILNVTENVFGNDENALAAGVVRLSGNHFAGDKSLPGATLLGNQFLALGNSADAGAAGRYHAATVSFAANLMVLSVLA